MLTKLKSIKFNPLLQIRVDSMHLLDQGITKLLTGMTLNVTATKDVSRTRSQTNDPKRKLIKLITLGEMLTTKVPSEVSKC